MPIRQLPPLLIDQIAAGEVVDRPASVVKELVENAVDAGATAVRVRLERGGRQLISVRDDGGGIPADELPLALAPHATSKIESARDLEAILTMGFRGEALASIASVARLAITSRPAGEDAGSIIESEAGSVRDVRPCAAPPGTLVEVRDLFYTVPARRKFMKSDTAEATRVAETLRSLALAHPTVGIALEVEGRTRFDLPRAQDGPSRIISILGEEMTPHLLPVDHTEAGVRVVGLVGTPELARPTARAMRCLLNGRPISDRTILHAMREGYRGLIEPGRSPTAVLHVRLDPERVDVNVHPQKTEVRFRDSGAVHAAVRHAIKNALAAAEILPAVDLSRASAVATAGSAGFARGANPSGTAGGGRFGRGSDAASDGAAAAAPPTRWGRSPAPAYGAGRVPPVAPGSAPVDIEAVRHAVDAPTSADDDAARAALFDRFAGGESGTATEGEPVGALPRILNAADVLRVHDTFLVMQDEQGLVIIDQHALHERIVFEELHDRIATEGLESQPMLAPVAVDVEPGLLEHLDALGPLLGRLGIEAAPLGPRSIGIHAVPTLLIERRVDLAAFMHDLLRRTDEDGTPPDTEGALSEVLDMMACKAAVKAGDTLQPQDIAELLAARDRIERSTNCPHGRPTTLRLTIHDLERQFGRR